MRIISGTHKGRTLHGPKSDRIRPAIDKVKQAIFNILGDVSGLQVLDLFAGTGSVGIEALSRGATHATFVDQLPEALQLIKKNLEMCQLLHRAKIVKVGVQNFEPLQSYDLIFVDPPYDKSIVTPTLRQIASQKILAPNGFIIVEHSPRELPEEVSGLELIDQRKYGQTLVSFLKGALYE